MCFHFSFRQSNKPERWNIYRSFLQTNPALLIEPPVKKIKPMYHVNGFEFNRHPIIIQSEPYHLNFYNWGLIPAEIKTDTAAQAIRSSNLSVRAERIFDKPHSKHLIKSHRCLIPADGFFEWMVVGAERIPFLIELKNPADEKKNYVFWFGGIYDVWINPSTGEHTGTFCLVTVKANEMMKTIHNTKTRMPFILEPGKEFEWIKPGLSIAAVEKLLRPLPDEYMKAHPVPLLINSKESNSNVPEVVKKVSYSVLGELNEQFA